MKQKRAIIQRILFGLIALIASSGTIFYFVLERDKPWTAFYVACCCGVLIVNLILILIFVRKNVK
jgi:hypothetical protein